jgi:hypothetical protein
MISVRGLRTKLYEKHMQKKLACLYVSNIIGYIRSRFIRAEYLSYYVGMWPTRLLARMTLVVTKYPTAKCIGLYDI